MGTVSPVSCNRLGAWTAAAGRTSCVLKGRQNALFGTGRDGKVYQDRFSAIRGHHPEATSRTNLQ